MRKRESLLVIFCASSAAVWLACSSVPAPTGWATDLTPTEQTGPGTEGQNGPVVGPGASDAASNVDGAIADGGVDPDPDDVDAAIYATPLQCSSGTHWTDGNKKSDKMLPGSACRKCHVTGGEGKKSFDMSGTVYKTAHEPNDCNGVSVSGATVVITDAKGVKTSYGVNAAGNFYHDDLFGFASLAKPFTTKVLYGGKERVMVGKITDGDCNKCHTQDGTELAPGRIILP